MKRCRIKSPEINDEILKIRPTFAFNNTKNQTVFSMMFSLHPSILLK